jgi:hypothetical protein
MGWICGLGTWVGMGIGYVGWDVDWVCGLGCGLGTWIGMWFGCSLLAYSAMLVPSKRLHTITATQGASLCQWTRHPTHKAQQLLLSNATIPIHKGFEFVHGDRPSGLFLGFGSSSLPRSPFSISFIVRCINSSFLAQERALCSCFLSFSLLHIGF